MHGYPETTAASRPCSQRRSGAAVGGLDPGGEPVEVGHRRFVFPHLERSEQVGVPLTLARANHRPDRHLRPGDLVVPLQDRPVLFLVEVEGEDDAVSTLDELTAGAREQRTELAFVGPVAKDDVVAGALQERAVELGPTARRDVDEDRSLWLIHRTTSVYRITPPTWVTA